MTSFRLPMHIMISTDTKVSTFVDANPTIMNLLARMDIPLGFGEVSVAQICSQAGIDPDTFLLLCKVYTDHEFRPSDSDLEKIKIRDIIKYLRATHSYYLDIALAKLSSDIQEFIQPCNEVQRKVILQFLEGYEEELRKHFQIEENEVLPYVEKLLNDGVSKDFLIEDFEEEQDDVEEKLDDLKNLVMKSLPTECNDNQRVKLLFFIYSLQADLACHSTIEDYILIPAVRILEGQETAKCRRERESLELTEREKEILVSVARGMLNKEIAYQYNISIYTVISHRKNITRKTGIKSVAGLTVYALLNGLIDVNSFE